MVDGMDAVGWSVDVDHVCRVEAAGVLVPATVPDTQVLNMRIAAFLCGARA